MLNIRIISKIYDNHSLSIVTRKTVLQFIKNGYFNLSIVPLDQYNPEAQVAREELLAIKPFINKELEKVDIEIRHSYPPILSWPEDDNIKVVYIQPWEYNRVPYEWVQTFQNFADLVVTPSNWCKDIYLNAGVNPSKVKVIPNGYDENIFNLDPPQSENRFFDDSKFIFTFVGNAQYRKGFDVLLQAWIRAFVKADNAVLFVKDTPAIYGTNNMLENIIQAQYKSGCGKIIYNDENLSETDMATIYKNSDVLVHPTRGEGFGMHIQEAMACNAMPMVTGVGAFRDFVTENNSILINAARNFIDVNDNRYFVGKPGDSYSNMGMHFLIPEPDPNDLANKMKYLYFHHERDKVLSRVVNDRKLTTWAESAEMFAKELELVGSSGKPVRVK